MCHSARRGSPVPAAEWTAGLQNSDRLGNRFETHIDSPFVETCGQLKRRGQETRAERRSTGCSCRLRRRLLDQLALQVRDLLSHHRILSRQRLDALRDALQLSRRLGHLSF